MSNAAYRCPICAGMLEWCFQGVGNIPVYKCSRDWADERLFVRDPVSGQPVQVRVDVVRHKDGNDYYAIPLNKAELERLQRQEAELAARRQQRIGRLVAA